MLETFLNGRAIVKVGDITGEEVDAMVNAANKTLLGGAGVDGAIHSRGGPQILEECKKIRETRYPDGLPTGEAVITTGGNLPAKHVIHTVGPIYGANAGRDGELLSACYRNCLQLAVESGLRSIAFPSISTGAYGYPKPEAFKVSSAAIDNFLKTDNTISEVRLVFFTRSDAQLFFEHHAF